MNININEIKYQQLLHNFMPIQDNLLQAIAADYPTLKPIQKIPYFFPSNAFEQYNDLKKIQEYYSKLISQINLILKTNFDIELLNLFVDYITIIYFPQSLNNEIYVNQCFKYLEKSFSIELAQYCKEEILCQVLVKYSHDEKNYFNGTIEKLIDYLDPLTEKHNQFNLYQIKT